MGTFTVTIDADRVGAGTETSAQLQVQFAAGRTAIKDSTGDRFIFPHTTAKEPTSIQLPTTLILETDVAAGAPANSEDIGYRIIVTVPLTGGKIDTGEFAARPADTVIDLTDLVADFTGPIAESIAVRAEVARDEAEAAAASVNPGAPNGTATLDGDGNLPETQVPDRLSAASLDVEIATEMATTDADSGSDFRTQQDARHAAKFAQVLTATSGDEAATLNAYLAAASPLGGKKLVGDFTIGSTVTLPDDTYLDLTAATITHTVAAETALSVGARCSVDRGKVISPASWDGTNTAWTYAVIEVTGAGSSVFGVTLENVPKVGIGLRTDDCRVAMNHITGNYPSGSWTGVETVHFGIALDPSASSAAGNLPVTGNVVESCVQGVFVGPYDGGGPAKGVTITGNTFEGCWNHGVYAYGEGVAISGNSFNRCQIPVATSGPRMSITGNTMYAQIGGSDQRDVAGISCREAIGCVVADNTIRGNAPAGSVIIDVRCSDTTICTDNVIHDNAIYVEGGSSQAIRVGANATTCENNIIHDNVIRSVGAPNLGIIAVIAGSGSTGLDNKIHDNVIVMRGETHGIYVSQQDGCVVSGNKVRLEYDAPSAKTLGMVFVTGNSVRTDVHHNSFKVTSAWGTNVTVRAIYEITGVTNNLYRHNDYRLDTTKLTAAVPLLIQGGSRIHEAGTGAPSVAAVVGSTWHRTDGGAGTSFYVKESGTTSAGWVGK